MWPNPGPGRTSHTLTLHDGDPVSSWMDSSTSGNNGTNTGTARPTFKTNILNGKPVVRYSSATAQLLNLTTGLSDVQPWVMFVVMKPAGAVDLWSLVAAGQNTYSAGAALQHRLDDYMVFFSDQIVGYYPPAGFGSAFHVYTVRAVNPSIVPDFHVDGTVYVPTVQGGGAVAPFTVLGQGDGDIAEIIYYQTNLLRLLPPLLLPILIGPGINSEIDPRSAADLANLEAYLGSKYGIAQTGGGTPVDPSTVAGLKGWWKADSLG